MKLNKLLLAGAIALGLVACKNNDLPETGKQEGTTFVTLQMKVNAKPSAEHTGTRAGVTGNFAGTPAEQLVTKVDLYTFSNDTKEEKKSFTIGTATSGALIFGKDGNVYQTMAIKTTAGSKVFYLVVNPTAETTAKLDAATTEEDFDKVHEMLVNNFFAAEHANFVMTGKVKQDIHSNISEAEANVATVPEKNLVSINVERVVSKTTVVATTGLVKEIPSGKVGNLTYSVENGNKSAYIFRQGAPYNTPNMNSGAWNIDWQNLYWQIGKTTDPSEYRTPIEVKTVADLATYNGKYFLENSNADNAWFWGNTSYAKIYTTFIPKMIDGAANTNTTATTFYKGFTDGLYYSTMEKAKAAGNTTAYKYNNGKCGYSILLNADNYDLTKVTKSPTQRNEYYILEIESIAGPGYNYDPNDPQDPNLPKPGEGDNTDNPDEPTDPIGPKPEDPIQQKETWMRVKATVLDWKTITNKVPLRQ